MSIHGISLCVRLEHGLLVLTDLGSDWDIPEAIGTGDVVDPGGVALRVLHQDEGPVTIDIGSSVMPDTPALMFRAADLENHAVIRTPSGALWVGDPDQLDGCLIAVPRGRVGLSWTGFSGPEQAVGYLKLVIDFAPS